LATQAKVWCSRTTN